jgi:hypothetical protein
MKPSESAGKLERRSTPLLKREWLPDAVVFDRGLDGTRRDGWRDHAEHCRRLKSWAPGTAKEVTRGRFEAKKDILVHKIA